MYNKLNIELPAGYAAFTIYYWRDRHNNGA